MPIIFVDMSLPKPSGEFEWVQESWGAALRCHPLAEVARHCFSTRRASMRPTSSALARRVRRRARRARSDATGPLRGCVSWRKQQAEQPTGRKPTSPSLTIRPSPLSVRAADCVPILLADRRTGAVAAIHAGWKGTAAGAAIVAVQNLTSRYGTNPEDVVAAVGPSIGPCCYEVGPDLASHFSSHAEAATLVHA